MSGSNSGGGGGGGSKPQQQQQQQQQHFLPWTPFSCFPAATLTISGLLQLDTADHEVELTVGNGPCELRWESAEYDGQSMISERPKDVMINSLWNSKQSDLTITLTTHRLVLFLKESKMLNQSTNPTAITTTTTNNTSSSKSYARFIHLSNIHVMEAKGGPSFLHPNSSYKILITTYTFGDFILSWRNGIGSSVASQRDTMVSMLDTALQRKAWEVATRFQQEQMARQGLTSRKVGVDHILTKHKLKHKQAAQVANDALSGDAEQLLQQATGLLQVIQSYTTLLNNHQKDHQQDNTKKGDDEPDVDFERLSSLLQDMGMTSGLTKDHFDDNRRRGRGGGGRNRNTANNANNSAYYEWLARQLVDFLMPRLPSMGGIITLTDVYCLFNRARGTNLISPEDLRSACDLLSNDDDSDDDDDDDNGAKDKKKKQKKNNRDTSGGNLQLPISQKIFSSGIVVLQLEECIPSPTTLMNLCPTTALQASHLLRLSPLLALEQFQEAEQAGYLCRDTTLETTTFYPNKFMTKY